MFKKPRNLSNYHGDDKPSLDDIDTSPGIEQDHDLNSALDKMVVGDEEYGNYDDVYQGITDSEAAQVAMLIQRTGKMARELPSKEIAMYLLDAGYDQTAENIAKVRNA